MRSNDAGSGDDLRASLAVAEVLFDAVRRRLYGVVRQARRPLTRDEAARLAGVSRGLAAFHLDKLVRAGLLRSGPGAAGAAPRVGRPPKAYELGPVEVHLDIPGRQHGLLAEVLLDVLRDRGDARETALEAAGQRGRALGRELRAAWGGGAGWAARGELDAVRDVLDGLGFEPYPAAPAVLRLATCPFRPMAAEAPELVCALNHALLAGLLHGMEVAGVAAELVPQAGECCVELRAATA
jgi:predicted ArsR family transcriptional regulator